MSFFSALFGGSPPHRAAGVAGMADDDGYLDDDFGADEASATRSSAPSNWSLDFGADSKVSAAGQAAIKAESAALKQQTGKAPMLITVLNALMASGGISQADASEAAKEHGESSSLFSEIGAAVSSTFANENAGQVLGQLALGAATGGGSLGYELGAAVAGGIAKKVAPKSGIGDAIIKADTSVAQATANVGEAVYNQALSTLTGGKVTLNSLGISGGPTPATTTNSPPGVAVLPPVEPPIANAQQAKNDKMWEIALAVGIGLILVYVITSQQGRARAPSPEVGAASELPHS